MNKKIITLTIGILLVITPLIISQILTGNISSINSNFQKDVSITKTSVGADLTTVTYSFDGEEFEIVFQNEELNNATLMQEWENNHNGINIIDWYAYKHVRQKELSNNDNKFIQWTEQWDDYLKPEVIIEEESQITIS